MNYIGSKYSLLDFIRATIQDVTGYTDGSGRSFADLFSGTGGYIYKNHCAGSGCGSNIRRKTQ